MSCLKITAVVQVLCAAVFLVCAVAVAAMPMSSKEELELDPLVLRQGSSQGQALVPPVPQVARPRARARGKDLLHRLRLDTEHEVVVGRPVSPVPPLLNDVVDTVTTPPPADPSCEYGRYINCITCYRNGNTTIQVV